MVKTKTSSIMKRKGNEHLPSTFIAVHFFLFLLLGSIGRTDAVDCGNCWCGEDVVTGYHNVICLGIPFAEIKNTFAGNTGFNKINSFNIVPELGDTQIPAGLLGIHTARIIRLASCGDNLMTIRRNAFRSSATSMEEFVVYDCNVASLVWTFLDSFTSVNLLQLEGAINIHSLGTLPSLLSLKRLSITDCKGFSSLNFPGSSLGGLQNLIMTENVELTDGKAESILATLNGASKLEMVSLKNNPSISRIPNTLANLVALHSLDVSLCDINSISSGSLSFSADVKLLNLTNNSLSDISDNSFDNGYYGNVKVSLDGNQLTKFSSTVFLKILTEMQTSKTPGSVSIRNNPVKCDDCQMAWLIRDYRELLPFVSGQCSNATEFQDLSPSWYDDHLCKSLLTTTTKQPTTSVQLTTTSSTVTNPTSLSSESSTVTRDVSPTTTENPNSSTVTLSTSSDSGTTQAPDPSAEINYDIYFYILYGVLGGIAFILIIGFIFLDYQRRRALRTRTSFDNSSSCGSSFSGFMDPEMHDSHSVEQRNYVRMPEPRPPTSPYNYLGNYQQSARQSYRGPAVITTPYYQQRQPARNPPSPDPPTGGLTGRAQGFKKVEFSMP